MERPIIIIGGGGHARVLVDTLRQLGATILGFTDRRQRSAEDGLLDIAYLGRDDSLGRFPGNEVLLVNGLGSVGPTFVRRDAYERFSRQGYQFAVVLHPGAVLSDPKIGETDGLQVMAGAIVGPGARLGHNVLVNTRAVVEHDCLVGDHSHIASGAVVCGDCRLGTGVHVGAGAVVNQGISVGEGAIVGSGAAVIEDVAPFSIVVGVPAVTKGSVDTRPASPP